jgi:hypothetical protein
VIPLLLLLAGVPLLLPPPLDPHRASPLCRISRHKLGAALLLLPPLLTLCCLPSAVPLTRGVSSWLEALWLWRLLTAGELGVFLDSISGSDMCTFCSAWSALQPCKGHWLLCVPVLLLGRRKRWACSLRFGGYVERKAVG